jgi:hypothetical protein
MRNITVSLDDKIYQRARMIAAERLKREERALRERIVNFDASDRLSRDEIHRRPLPHQTSL